MRQSFKSGKSFFPRGLTVGLLFVFQISLLLSASSEAITLSSSKLTVDFDTVSQIFSITHTASGVQFLRNGKIDEKATSWSLSAITDTTLKSVFGGAEGQALKLVCPGKDFWIMLCPDFDFALFKTVIKNTGSSVRLVIKYPLLSAEFDLKKSPSVLRAQGTVGPTTVDGHDGSYMYLAIADPETRNGVVTGWFTTHRGTGELFSGSSGGSVTFNTAMDFGQRRIPAGGNSETDVFGLGYFDDALLGLEQYASSLAKVYAVKLPPKPVGFCTWYSEKYGYGSDEVHVQELAHWANRNLQPYGFGVVQIDLGWQKGTGDWGVSKNFTESDPAKYPGGMKAIADTIKKLNMTPGIWLLPFGRDIPYTTLPDDYYVKRRDGTPYTTWWGGTSLDMTNPVARQYAVDVIKRPVTEWGYRYLKLDGIYTGLAAGHCYPHLKYMPDDTASDAVFSDPTKSNVEAYRMGLSAIREAVGKDVYILACNAAQNQRILGASIGLVDAMRVGPDNGASYNWLTKGIVNGSRRYFFNNRIWHNDPDVVYVRNSEMPINHARLMATWNGVSGQLMISGDWLPDLAPDRIKILQSLIPSHGRTGRPVDFFEDTLQRVWIASDTVSDVHRRNIVGLLNYDESINTIDRSLDNFGLSPTEQYVGFDFWNDSLVPQFSSALHWKVPSQDAVLLALRQVSAEPQIISTSRHVSQGMIEIADETWNSVSRELSWKSSVIGNDPFEVRIVNGPQDAPWKIATVTVSDEDKAAGVTVSYKTQSLLTRVTLNASANRQVSVKAGFEPNPAYIPSVNSGKIKSFTGKKVNRAGNCLLFGDEYGDLPKNIAIFTSQGKKVCSIVTAAKSVNLRTISKSATGFYIIQITGGMTGKSSTEIIRTELAPH